MKKQENQYNSILNSESINSIPNQVVVKEEKNNQSEVYSVGTVDESMLTVEEKERIEEYSNEIDITDVDQIVKYGVDAQRNISKFSMDVLEKVKTHDMGEIGDSLKELTLAIDATVEPEKKGIFGIFQKAKQGVSAVQANYAKAETNVNKIEEDLLNHESFLIQDISMYQQMYELNLQYYKELTIYIFAGQKALDKARSTTLSKLKSIANNGNKQEDTQAYRDYEDLCYRFEKKLVDLETTREISIQTVPQVRLLQNNDRELLDKLQSSIANTIPLWRNQLVISLGIEHTKRALEAQNTLVDKTNELMKKNSETLKMATIETAKAVERPMVDMETLNQCNRELISTFKEIVKIHNQGTEKRMQVREELLRIESELKRTMLETDN